MNKIIPFLKSNQCPLCHKQFPLENIAHCICGKSTLYQNSLWVTVKNYQIRSSKVEEKTIIYMMKGNNLESKLELNSWLSSDWFDGSNLESKIESLLFYK
jgi:hypothetical protein